MKDRIIGIAISAAMVCSHAAAVFADDNAFLNASFDLNDGAAVLSGKMGTSEKLPLTVIFAQSGTEVTDENPPVLAYMIFTGENGVINERIKLSEKFPGGKYSVYIRSAEGNAESSIIVFSDKNDDTKAVLAEINGAKDYISLAEYLKSDGNMEKLGFDSSETENNTELAAKLLIQYKNGDYNASSAAKTVKYALAFAETKKSGAESAMKKYAEAFGATYADYAALDKKTSEELSVLLNEFKPDLQKKMISFDDFVLTAQTRRAAKDGWSQLRDCVLQNAERLGADVESGSVYMKIPSGSRYKVFSQMCNDVKKAQTVAEIAELFEKNADSVYKDTKKSANSSSSSSSSGGGTSVVEVTVPETKPAESEPLKFSDIAGHYSEEAVEFLAAKKIISGYENGEFRPQNNVTRAEFAQLIMAQFDFKAEKTAKFSDVSENDWFSEPVSILASSGIIKGDGEKFMPYDSIKREDAAVIIARALQKCGVELSGRREFKDDDKISSYAAESVGALAAKGILLGSDGYFSPESSITRGETAVMLYRAFNAWMEETK